MSIELTVTGIYTPGGIEDRHIVNLDVDYEGNLYKWQMYIPPETDLATYVAASTERIKLEIDLKEAEWVTAPKTSTYEDPFNGTVTIDIAKEEVVKPDIPDYYAKRRAEYPSLGEQMGAVFKGTDSEDYIRIQAEIAAIKLKYPKPY
jgi:hypothetical protein